MADGGMGETFALDKTGAWAIESLVYFFTGALAIACLGAFLGGGKFGLAVRHCRMARRLSGLHRLQ
jgi:hypothetical protein